MVENWCLALIMVDADGVCGLEVKEEVAVEEEVLVLAL